MHKYRERKVEKGLKKKKKKKKKQKKEKCINHFYIEK